MHDLEERSFNEWLVIESQRGEKDVTQENLISISRSLRKLSDPAGYPK